MLLPKTKLLPHYYGKPSWENDIGYLIDARGNRLPGITSIMEATKSPLQKEQLIRWRERIGTAEANRISKESRDRGTLIHDMIKNYFLGKSLACPDFIKSYWENLLPILENIDNIRLIEGCVFHYYLGYAGRVDCVASYLGIPCVIEFKSAERIKPLYDEPLQLAAYCGALNRQYGLKLNNTLLILTTPNEASVTWFEPEEVMKYWHQWQSRVTAFWEKRSTYSKASA